MYTILLCNKYFVLVDHACKVLCFAQRCRCTHPRAIRYASSSQSAACLHHLPLHTPHVLPLCLVNRLALQDAMTHGVTFTEVSLHADGVDAVSPAVRRARRSVTEREARPERPTMCLWVGSSQRGSAPSPRAESTLAVAAAKYEA